ncbi:type IV pilin-like G/H family protein [Dolichospermum sp. UHCC 0259]|uniref:type IV pilin-like G/H family protein n=1 Tax=Dolichospermum sp. UHCC 0259 TaxID=2590010 RepID=UPI001447B7CB|nr:type IV pilin-like G/H family protein [Dolichospermum sp. UHCC 0259]MTJ47258.1 prepilin-type N-terminal cleavage/methylation domain-containing protein [Dolichospermum sp. UHCC 0259]
MKTELKAKFIQQILSKKKDNEGFTLIELLVVIIIIGILSAIALPSFLNQAAKAKQSEAKTYVGSVNRAQQSYRIENTSFATTFDNLKIGIPSSTDFYTYTIPSADTTSTVVLATTKDPNSLKGFSGGVVILTSGQTEALACQTTGVQTATSVAAPSLSTTPQASACTGLENMK